MPHVNAKYVELQDLGSNDDVGCNAQDSVIESTSTRISTNAPVTAFPRMWKVWPDLFSKSCSSLQRNTGHERTETTGNDGSRVDAFSGAEHTYGEEQSPPSQGVIMRQRTMLRPQLHRYQLQNGWKHFNDSMLLGQLMFIVSFILIFWWTRPLSEDASQRSEDCTPLRVAARARAAGSGPLPPQPLVPSRYDVTYNMIYPGLYGGEVVITLEVAAYAECVLMWAYDWTNITSIEVTQTNINAKTDDVSVCNGCYRGEMVANGNAKVHFWKPGQQCSDPHSGRSVHEERSCAANKHATGTTAAVCDSGARGKSAITNVRSGEHNMSTILDCMSSEGNGRSEGDTVTAHDKGVVHILGNRFERKGGPSHVVAVDLQQAGGLKGEKMALLRMKFSSSMNVTSRIRSPVSFSA
ncbi:hypothetical protein CYMTET_45578 [Cymbomonas tetramitiformis]|uniref:Transmembrane protein n=1 Tax=Cymbomonas tetramitiformis TaxID=36881 RepID=A0AAE0BZ82_9CHLO|nr:hypothetical protein CYMTET_45578 [Cymbomonas tetramitiformis]